MGVACFRRSYSKTQSSGGGGGEGVGGGRVKSSAGKKREKREETGARFSLPSPSLVAACIFPRQIFARALLS